MLAPEKILLPEKKEIRYRKSMGRIWGIVLVGLLLTGCTAFRKKPNTDLMQSVNLSPSAKKALDESTFIAGDWPDPNWWEQYGDPQLNEVVENALGGNPTLQTASETVKKAEALATKALSSLIPHFSGHWMNNYMHLSDHSLFRLPPSNAPSVLNQVDLGVSMNYEIDFFGKNQSKYKAAIGDYYSQMAANAMSNLKIAHATTIAYVRFTYLTLRVELYDEIIDSLMEVKDLTLLRKAHNLDSQFPLLQIEEGIKAAEKVRTLYQSQKDIAVMQLRVLMGMSPDAEFEMKRPRLVDVYNIALPNKLSIDLLARRPDVMAARWNAEARAADIGAAKAAYYPSVNLFSYGGLESLSYTDLFNVSSFMGMLLPSINLPIFTGFELEADLNKAHAEYSIAVYEYNGKVLEAANDVAKTLRLIQADKDKKDEQYQKTFFKKREEELMALRFENGISQKIDVLQKKIAYLQERAELLNDEQNYYEQVINLNRALGGGYGSKPRESKPTCGCKRGS